MNTAREPWPPGSADPAAVAAQLRSTALVIREVGQHDDPHQVDTALDYLAAKAAELDPPRELVGANGTAYTRVYLHGALESHLTLAGESRLMCEGGRRPGIGHVVVSDEWMGTGDQDEYAWAAVLPLCRGCAGFARENGLTL